MIHLESHRELFVDDFMLEKLDGANLKMCKPRIEEIPLAGGGYNTVIYESGLYRLYYKKTLNPKRTYTGNPWERVCYSESKDGVNFTKPDLGIINEKNGGFCNVILDETAFCHNFSPFIDNRSNVSAKERYKALAGIWHNNFKSIQDDDPTFPADFEAGLYTFASADGIHWQRTSKKPVITSVELKAFDSQNVGFWSESEDCYICYFRTWGPGGVKDGCRSIARTTSVDFINWSEPVHMHPNEKPEEFYTSQTAPYFRAPHIYLAFPTRFMRDRGDSTDILFMSTRGGNSFDRTFRDAIVRPGLDKTRWGNRSNYATLNLVPLDKKRMCFYMFTNRGVASQMVVFRTDGVSSLSAGWKGGTVLTKPFTFKGGKLELNYSTSVAGAVRCEMLAEDGSTLDGFSMNDCDFLVGDEISAYVSWRRGDLSTISGSPVRLKFELLEADVFSFRFVDI